MKMKKTMIYLPEEMHAYLMREAASQGSSMAEIAREAIVEYRARRAADGARGVSSLFGCIADDLTDTDLALRVDEGLAEHFSEGGEWERESGLCGR